MKPPETNKQKKLKLSNISFGVELKILKEIYQLYIKSMFPSGGGHKITTPWHAKDRFSFEEK